MNVSRAQVKELKNGKLVVIDGEPCRVVGVTKGKSGKHGAAKARVDAVSLFTGNKKVLLKPVDADCEIPILERKNAQVVAVMGDRAQLMDLETYETYEEDIPEEFRGKLESGQEVEVQVVMGKRTITRIK